MTAAPQIAQAARPCCLLFRAGIHFGEEFTPATRSFLSCGDDPLHRPSNAARRWVPAGLRASTRLRDFGRNTCLPQHGKSFPQHHTRSPVLRMTVAVLRVTGVRLGRRQATASCWT